MICIHIHTHTAKETSHRIWKQVMDWLVVWYVHVYMYMYLYANLLVLDLSLYQLSHSLNFCVDLPMVAEVVDYHHC